VGTRDSTARRIQPGHEHIVEELAGLPESDRYAIVEAADEEARRRARALTSTETIDSSADLGHVLPQALELPRDDRTRLAVLLLESIEASEQDGDVEDAWLDEITRRLDEHEKGTVQAIPAEVVFAEARDRLKRARG
jgi:putative addiction module component (TIGR02574 family)